MAGATAFISTTVGYLSVFTPTILPGTLVTATLGMGIMGVSNDGVGLQQPVTWSFTTNLYKWLFTMILKNSH